MIKNTNITDNGRVIVEGTRIIFIGFLRALQQLFAFRCLALGSGWPLHSNLLLWIKRLEHFHVHCSTLVRQVCHRCHGRLSMHHLLECTAFVVDDCLY